MPLRLTGRAAELRILGLDSATAACSAAVLDSGRIVVHRMQAMRHGHGTTLPVMIAEAMEEAGRLVGLDFLSLDAVAVTVGPGGFTGVRVGLAAARGVALAAGCPAVGVTTFDAVAASAVPLDDGPLLVAVDSRREDFYVQLFDVVGGVPTAVGPPVATIPGEVLPMLPAGPVRVLGDAADRLRAVLAGRASFPTDPAAGGGAPDARSVAALGALRLAVRIPRDLPEPLYIRGPSVRLPDRQT